MRHSILIVGGTGVISSAVAEEAHQQGIAVTMINRGNRIVPSWAELIKCDRNDYNTIEKYLKNRHYTSVIDFLCYTDQQTKDSFSFYSSYTDQYFFVSSCAVFDKTIPGIKTETSPKPLDIWSYSVNKFKSEVNLIALASKSKCHYTIVRPCITYGNTRIPYGISPRYGYHWTLCARILSGKPIITWNEGKNCSNMMRVEDFAVGLVGLIGNPMAYDEDFNICGDEMPTFKDVLLSMSKALGKQIRTVDVTPEFYADEIPERRGEILGGRAMDATNSNQKLKSVVPNFRQRIKLEDGVKMTVEAYKAQNYQHSIDWVFDADTDRIIKAWNKANNIPSNNYKTGFIDYLGNATYKDKITYWLTVHKKNSIIRMLISCAKMLKRFF